MGKSPESRPSDECFRVIQTALHSFLEVLATMSLFTQSAKRPHHCPSDNRICVGEATDERGENALVAPDGELNECLHASQPDVRITVVEACEQEGSDANVALLPMLDIWKERHQKGIRRTTTDKRIHQEHTKKISEIFHEASLQPRRDPRSAGLKMGPPFGWSQGTTNSVNELSDSRASPFCARSLRLSQAASLTCSELSSRHADTAAHTSVPPSPAMRGSPASAANLTSSSASARWVVTTVTSSL